MTNSWQFTDLYKHSNRICRYSPDSNYIAVLVGNQLVIRSHPDLVILHVYTKEWPIDAMGWSPNSEKLFIASIKQNQYEAHAMNQADWSCRFKDPHRMIANIRFASDSNTIFNTQKFHHGFNVFSLRHQKAFTPIDNVKFKDRGYVASPDFKWFGLLRRKDHKDWITICDVETYEIIENFEIDTVDAQDISISPDGLFIAAIDVSIYYKLVVYRPDASRVTTFSAYDDGLGVKSITWSPNTRFLAINSYDHKSRLLSTFDWKQLEEFTHHTKYLEDSNLEIHVEKEIMSGAPHAGFDVRTSARHIPMLRPDHEKANPKTAINTKFNCMGNFMMTLSGESSQIVACAFVFFTDVHTWTGLESIPTTACIWDMSTMASHAIIALQEPIVSAVWNPKLDSLLAICCESGRFYIWQNGKQHSHRSALSVVNIPAGGCRRTVFGNFVKF
ncbi:hypothetical protein NQZ79_g7745 [Umbelopsis isabellina]|nr:hypothetical protein NQZ79_g7745 [Umbelopsis isabellina]